MWYAHHINQWGLFSVTVYYTKSFFKTVNEGFKQLGKQPKVKADTNWYTSNAQNTYNSGVNDRS